MSDKTLGQVAYEAYGEAEAKVLGQDRWRRWDRVDPEFTPVWEAAAEAVVAAAEHPDWHAHYERMKAVIEAAQKWYAKTDYAKPGTHAFELERAVEALEAAEKR